MVRAHVDYRKLNNLPGYSGHSIVIFDYDNHGFFFHDPGPKPHPNRHETFDHLEKAMFGNDKEGGEINLIKLKRQND